MKLAPARRVLGRAATVATLLLIRATCADVLPDDRADLFYSKYSGGGMEITGESVAVRKKFTENFAISGNYFVDKVSGASIDVLSQASQIKDERIQKSATLEFVHDKTTYNATYQTSVERDYRSDTSSISLKQDMFGDLTTLSLAFANTDDKIGENNGSAFVPIITWLGHASSRSYDIDLSQILTKNLIGGVNFNVITDQGYLANPYRSIRYLDAGTPKGYSLGSQTYPDTRTSTAIQGELKYFLPYRAAITGSFRYFRDTWSIVGKTFEADYTHPISNVWILEGRLRYYTQNHADFYSDLFQYADEYRFEGRDQDLAAQNNYTIGAKATYAFLPNGWKIFKRATVTFDASRITFHYKDFTNIKDFGLPQYQPGSEPLYQFNATVYQVYMSMFF
jgi:uncharacterized protein DUF3570